jgi:DNA-binding CsgD family transcriptional regulator
MQRDAIALIESAYDLDGATEAWLRRVAVAAAPLTRRRYGVALIGWSTRNNERAITHVDFENLPGMDHETLAKIGTPPLASQFDAMYPGAPPVALASTTIGHSIHSVGDGRDPVHQEVIARYQVRDYAAMHGRADAHRGIIISFALYDGDSLSRREAHMWSRLAVHVGTGLRLHERLQAARDREPDAILAPNGRVLHAERDAATKPNRDELTSAARTLDRARGKLRRTDPDEAVELWRALVRGEWSLVDRFDSDGRRFVVAHKNVPAVETRRNVLSHREARVADLLSRGYSNKLIAYELGLAPSTVAGTLGQLCRRLGAASNVELVRLLRTDP